MLGVSLGEIEKWCAGILSRQHAKRLQNQFSKPGNIENMAVTADISSVVPKSQEQRAGWKVGLHAGLIEDIQSCFSSKSTDLPKVFYYRSFRQRLQIDTFFKDSVNSILNLMLP